MLTRLSDDQDDCDDDKSFKNTFLTVMWIYTYACVYVVQNILFRRKTSKDFCLDSPTVTLLGKKW